MGWQRKQRQAIKSVGFAFLFIWGGSLYFAGCAARGVVLSSPKDDQKVGKQVAVQVEQTIGYYDEASAKALVQRVGHRLVQQLGDTPYTFRFRVVNQIDPNAFAAPGGYIYVSRGLLALCNSEDELAGVIGHEITHVTKRHSAKQQSRGILPGLLSIPGQAVGIFTPALGGLLQAPFAGIMATYSRSQETEADNGGMSLAAKAGYDPAKISNILENIERVVTYVSGEKRKFSFFDSHPMTPSRTQNIEKRAPTLEVSQNHSGILGPQAFMQKLQGLVLAEDPAYGIFLKDRFLHPRLNISLALPGGWEKVNLPIVVGAQKKESRNHAPAMVAMTMLSKQEKETPRQAASKYTQHVKKEARQEPTYEESLDLNGRDSYHVYYLSRSRKGDTHVHLIWMTFNGQTFQFVGVGGKEVQKEVFSTARSLRPLSQAERNSIKVRRLELARSKPGETWEAFAKRAKNVWQPELTAIVNGGDQELLAASAKANHPPLKIAVEKPYR